MTCIASKNFNADTYANLTLLTPPNDSLNLERLLKTFQADEHSLELKRLCYVARHAGFSNVADRSPTITHTRQNPIK